MVRVDTNTMTIMNLYKRNVNPNGDVFEGDQIKVSSDFQRGDEETGVWDKKRKQGFIDSLHKNYPTGILTFVKDYGIATAYQDNWVTLDGGNRFRAIRDYMNDKFLVNDILYSDLEPDAKAAFNNIILPCQWLSIERTDPSETIAQMFTRLNTTAKSLSQGELIKAHGWKGNISEIELAKAIIGNCWTSSFNEASMFDGFEDKIIEIKTKWQDCFGELLETKRYDSLAMMVGYIVSAKTSNFTYFEKKYDTIKHQLTEEVFTLPVIEYILKKLFIFIELIQNINDKSILGRFTKGVPSQSKIATIWYKICDGSIDKLFFKKLVWFYNEMIVDEELKNDFTQIHERSGDNHTTQTKILNSLQFISSHTEHITD